MIRCFLVAMMSLEDNKHALYQLLAHPKYDLGYFLGLEQLAAKIRNISDCPGVC